MHLKKQNDKLNEVTPKKKVGNLFVAHAICDLMTILSVMCSVHDKCINIFLHTHTHTYAVAAT